MHSISLSDTVTVTYNPSKATVIRMSAKGNKYLPTDDKNLAVKAAKLFLETACITATIHIHLEKHIPIAAGLAGGSSDAAATLRAMNKLFDKLFTDRALYKIAEKLGSDVPYCLIGGTALCYGRGEKMDRLPERLDLKLVVAVADEYVSTPMAYAELDSIFEDFKAPRDLSHELALSAVIESLSSGVLPDGELYNIFENAVFKTCFGAESIKTRMLELGATHALMSGSGPSVFGIFPSEVEAVNAVEDFTSRGIRAYFAESIVN